MIYINLKIKHDTHTPPLRDILNTTPEWISRCYRAWMEIRTTPKLIWPNRRCQHPRLAELMAGEYYGVDFTEAIYAHLPLWGAFGVSSTGCRDSGRSEMELYVNEFWIYMLSAEWRRRRQWWRKRTSLWLKLRYRDTYTLNTLATHANEHIHA